MSDSMLALLELQNLDNAVARGNVEATPYRMRKRRQLVQLIPEPVALNYKRVHGRHSNAVVQVVEGVCQGCFVELPNALLSRLEDPRNVVTCDHCGRILYSSF